MKKYQEFEIVPQDDLTHLRVRGGTVQELFRNALRGTAAFLAPDALKAVSGKKIKQGVCVQAVDLSSLLVEFITHALAEADTRGLMFTGVAFRAFGENFLEAELAGTPVAQADREIRAVSYADVDIKKNPENGLFETTLVFEV